ncbi:MAG: hypothetical protein OXB92_11505 [Acidimicrobiaceae bacterium]|nr:hypothetical protein [Acidimicrobiia bacterium]MCY4494470.1 hypothetical protein [Acidimicrobiaceae bacterium]
MTEATRPHLLIEDRVPVTELAQQTPRSYPRTTGPERGRAPRAPRPLLADD